MLYSALANIKKMSDKEIEKICDKMIPILPYKGIVVNYEISQYFKLKNPEFNLNKHKEIINPISDFLENNKYIEKKGLSDFSLTEKGILAKDKGGHFEYLKSLKPKKFWKKPEFVIPTIISFFALLIPFITRYLDNKEKKESNNKKEIIAISDSISKALYHRQDSLLQTTNKRIDVLSISLDSLLIKHHSLKNGGMN